MMRGVRRMIHVAVIAYGYWGPNLVRNFLETDGADMMACCDMSQQRLAQAKVKHPALRLTTDYDEVVNDTAVDAVAIATPVGTHYAFARKALEHGKHVLVEKP